MKFKQHFHLMLICLQKYLFLVCSLNEALRFFFTYPETHLCMFIKLLSAIKKLYQEPVLQHCLCSLFDCLTSITYLEMKIKVNVMILI